MRLIHAELGRRARALALRARFVVSGILLWALADIAPRLAARWLDLAFWHSPLRYPSPAREYAWRQAAQPVRIDHRGRRLAAYAWGEGAPVLLVHGWSGRALQYGEIAAALQRSGYRAIAFDAPAHGASPGCTTTFLEMRDVILEIGARHGPFHAIVAHSGGCTPAALAARQLSPVPRMVCLSPLASLTTGLERMHARMNVPPRVRIAHRRRLVEQYGADSFHLYSLDHVIADLAAEGLIIHDRHDEEVPFAEMEQLVRRWPRARLVATRGYGHYRLLREPAVVGEVVRFVGAR